VLKDSSFEGYRPEIMFVGKRRIHQQESALGAWQSLIDALCIALGLFVAGWNDVVNLTEHYIVVLTLAILFYSLIAHITGANRSWRGVSTGRELLGVCISWGITLCLLLALAFAAKFTADFSRLTIVKWSFIVPVLIVLTRMVIHTAQQLLLRLGYRAMRFAIIGVTELGFQLAQNIADSPGMGLKLVGFYDDRVAKRNPIIPDNLGRQVGSIQDLIDQAREGEIDRIYITFPMRAERRIRRVLDQLSDTPASVYVVPDFFVFQLLHSRWTDILGLPVVSVFEHPFYGIDGLVKRASDLFFGSFFLAITAIPMLIIALLIKLTSHGPAMFRQSRYGLDGQEIQVWKFRTMSVCEEGTKAVQAKENDPRVTPIGRILRQYSLDELPQLFNVIGGSMSLVGPRPHVNVQNEEFRTRVVGYMLRHKVKPGITGLAQVNGWRGATDTPERLEKRIECDLRYIREWSLLLDVKILMKTFGVVFSKKNAY
jgi:putative colanic acid biosysnthesis UDP-glucose lipid carrier transferase